MLLLSWVERVYSVHHLLPPAPFSLFLDKAFQKAMHIECHSNMMNSWWHHPRRCCLNSQIPCLCLWVSSPIWAKGIAKPFSLLFLYSWTRLSKARAAKCHALVCSNVIQTSATLGDFTLSSAWRVRQCLSLDSMGQLPHLGHWQTFLKFKHRHMAHVMGVLVHYGTQMSCTTCMGYKFTANPLQHALIFFNFQK